MTEEKGEGSGRLNLKREAAVQEKYCPHCRAVMDPEAVLCLQCGYNLQTGRLVSATSARKRGVGARPLAVVVLLAIAGATYVGLFQPDLAEAAKEKVFEWTAGLRNTRMVSVSPGIGEQAPLAEVVESDGDEEESVPEGDVEGGLAEVLDREFPLFVSGGPAELTTLAGHQLTGTLGELTATHVTIETADGPKRGLISFLEPVSQVRCCPRCRKAFLLNAQRVLAGRQGADPAVELDRMLNDPARKMRHYALMICHYLTEDVRSAQGDLLARIVSPTADPVAAEMAAAA